MEVRWSNYIFNLTDLAHYENDGYPPKNVDDGNEEKKALEWRSKDVACPTGIVNESTFKEVYAQFFPQGGE
ncbi:hypothetical protein TNCT_547291 [Trichonephila clavata]|uniref:Uncharacterized protein n=1 Tax=Trichonephila clavata TaxID=2740835 RepID=A0A8X6FTI2_TRICU|nr:hypothetical protein TNCT_547291 [Trichonephila clavata]